jgi:hypothetical protein
LVEGRGGRSLGPKAHLCDLLAQLDEDNLRRGRQFERICKWFLTNDPLYQHQVRRVWLWDEWPGRWGADAGIDLIVEDREGGLWAVQAKAYDPDYSETKADVDTFLSESSRSQFSYRLLIATTNRVGQTARGTLAAQEKQAGLLLLADLEAAQVDWPSSPAALRPKAPKRKRPRPHQTEAASKQLRRQIRALAQPSPGLTPAATFSATSPTSTRGAGRAPPGLDDDGLLLHAQLAGKAARGGAYFEALSRLSGNDSWAAERHTPDADAERRTRADDEVDPERAQLYTAARALAVASGISFMDACELLDNARELRELQAGDGTSHVEDARRVSAIGDELTSRARQRTQAAERAAAAPSWHQSYDGH